MLKINNTLTKTKQEFKSLKPRVVSFYQCGPTVYWTQHIGNLRAMVLADLIVRSLEYLGYKVRLVRNYTDVGHLTSDQDEGEDKMAQAAKREKSDPKQIAEKYIRAFESDVDDLNCLAPWKKPLATKHIKEMAKIVQLLVDKGYAYATDLAIYFDVSKFENYTQLSGQDLSKNISEAGKGDVADKDKKHPADFAVWFFKAGAHKNALQTWPVKFKNINQPTKQGFPGWHLECSAMSRKYLGDTMDIHMGGVEHIPVHHTNEIAQSEAATGKKFVNYWLHNEHLTVDGAKMSKSEGTAYSLEEIKKKGFEPLALRYFFMQAHYRSRQNFTWEALAGAQTALNNIRNEVLNFSAAKGDVNVDFKNRFIAALEDDFNLPQALAISWEVFRSDLSDSEKKATILDFDKVFGLDLAKLKPIKIPLAVEKLARARLAARAEKNWAKSDKLRDEILKKGFEIEDTKEGYKIRRK
ncbi:MAG TPA: cysteine--tRNA ligase [bacterium]|nr:cysteine--tRNA ligase [bacterium]HPW39197.1 cysteine--tRNA ligase [bacterium]